MSGHLSSVLQREVQFQVTQSGFDLFHYFLFLIFIFTFVSIIPTAEPEQNFCCVTINLHPRTNVNCNDSFRAFSFFCLRFLGGFDKIEIKRVVIISGATMACVT